VNHASELMIMYSIKAAMRLLDRMGSSIGRAPANPSTMLGNWFAKPLFWRPQYALFVSESTYLPVLAPLAPAFRLAVRIPDDLAVTLQSHGAPDSFIEDELDAMDDVVVTRTDSRQVVGVMNKFASMATRMRDLHPNWDSLQIAMCLAEVAVGIYGARHIFPEVALRELIDAHAHQSFDK
jgi:hypothetical protein